MKQNIINKNNGWNDNNQNPWGKNNSNQDFDNMFNGLQKLLSKFLPGGGKGWRGFFAILLILFGLWSLSGIYRVCLLYTSPSPRDRTRSRMPSSA